MAMEGQTKNLVLAGVKSVTLHDEGIVRLWDLSSNFIFSENDVGKNRALASVQKLQEMNNAVAVFTLTTKLCKEELSKFQAVVFTDISLEKAVEFNNYCRGQQPPISFIKTEVRGLFGSVFCDFGPEFTVIDVDGEEPHSGVIASISNESPACVTCVNDEHLFIQDGDMVVFTEVKGMTELNDGMPRKVKNVKIRRRPYSFELDVDTSTYGLYETGGLFTQVKQPETLHFKSLQDALLDPGDLLVSDFSKYERPPILHLAFQALDGFVNRLGRFPAPGSEKDAQKLISVMDAISPGYPVDSNLIRLFAFGSSAVLNPMAAMFGGIVGQEVLKACSGKFRPLYQFLYFDSIESLPNKPLDPNDLRPLNSRYDAQISVFGAKLQKKLEDTKVFLVGAGALGGEFLKNLALMGVSCSCKGNLTITDDDVIEKSNLSRQFLFRDWNIGQAKSTVAASGASLINPRLHVNALLNRANPETENVFNDAFWENVDVVISAMDNITARKYMDQRCLCFQKPLLDSGTLGAKCTTQMIIPHMSANYDAKIHLSKPFEEQAPLGTLRSFPHNINHCLIWARLEFEGLLEKTPAEVNAYLANPSKYISALKDAVYANARDKLESVMKCLDVEHCKTFQDCINWARSKFEDYFVNRVKQLTFTFPEECTSTGVLFWSAPKRFPRAVQFTPTDSSHLQFIMAASVLRAETFKIPIPDWANDPSKLTEAVDRVLVPCFEPRKDADFVTDEKARSLTTVSTDDDAAITNLVAKLSNCVKRLHTGFLMKPIQFKKDDDTNHHMDMIIGLANMRARNYAIPEVDKFKAKVISGVTIPAIATSTAMATGLVCLELYKVVDRGHKVDDYRNTFTNLALPMFVVSEPFPPKVMKHRDKCWTLWDRWILKNDPRIRDLLQWLEEMGIKCLRISCHSTELFDRNNRSHLARINRKVIDLVREVAKIEIPADRRHVDVVACDSGIEIPLVSVYFR